MKCKRCNGKGTVLITWPTTSAREDDRAICGQCHGSGEVPEPTVDMTKKAELSEDADCSPHDAL